MREKDTAVPQDFRYLLYVQGDWMFALVVCSERGKPSLVAVSGTRMKLAIASPVVKIGFFLMALATTHKMTALTTLKMMTTIANGRLNSTLHLSGTSSPRQYFTGLGLLFDDTFHCSGCERIFDKIEEQPSVVSMPEQIQSYGSVSSLSKPTEATSPKSGPDVSSVITNTLLYFD